MTTATELRPAELAEDSSVSDAIRAGLIGAKILIVDDKEANLLLLDGVLRGAGYTNLTSVLDPREVCPLYAEHHYDLILLDLRMPGMDGFEVIERLKEIEAEGYLPVLVITAEPGHKLRALRAGAKDFISKPFDIAEVLTRVHNMLEVRLLHVELKRKYVELRALFDELVAERKVNERLALQAPADSIASRLAARPDVTPESFPDATILIADVVGFADASTTLSPERMEQLLAEIFSKFDALVVARGFRKIKTLANSYMAAGGVPVASADDAAESVYLALEMVAAVDRFNAHNETSFQLRAGIACGEVIAAVIGKRMYVYDVWGGAVNAASSMEAHSVAGRVLASEEVRNKLGAEFIAEARGGGDGEAKGWFVTRAPL
jgi:adenylate cyclase